MDSWKQLFIGTVLLTDKEAWHPEHIESVLVTAFTQEEADDAVRKLAEELVGSDSEILIHTAEAKPLHLPAALFANTDLLYSNLVKTRTALNNMVSNKDYVPLKQATALLTQINDYDTFNPNPKIIRTS